MTVRVSTLMEGANTTLTGSTLSARVSGAVDVIALIVNADGKVATDADMVFFNQLTAPGVRLEGTTVHLDLTALRPAAERVVLAAAPEHAGADFTHLPITLLIRQGQDSGSGSDIRFAPARLSSETVAVLAEIYQRGGTWKVRAVGQGYDTGLAGLATDFGVQVDDDGTSTSTDVSSGTGTGNSNGAATPPVSPMLAPSTAPAHPHSPSDPGDPGHSDRKPNREPREGPHRDAGPRPTTGPVLFDLWNQRGAYLQVAGCQHHKDAIAAVLGNEHRPDGAEHDLTARLIPDPTNPHDRHAVAVHVRGRRIGYLPATEAGYYAPVLTDLTARGLLPQVRVRIWARTMSEWDDTIEGFAPTGELYANATLALGPPHLIVPANLAPAGAELLPEGGAIQVSGVDQHVDVTAAYTHHHPQQWVHVSLHELLEHRPRSSRTIVEVRLDGSRVGQLTPKMSEELLPAIRHLHTAGLATAARALLHGNQAAAKLTLHTIRANALTNEWFSQFAK